jgi:hypothetical protein
MIVKFGEVLGLGVLATDALFTVGAFEEDPPPQPVKFMHTKVAQSSTGTVMYLLLCEK